MTTTAPILARTMPRGNPVRARYTPAAVAGEAGLEQMALIMSTLDLIEAAAVKLRAALAQGRTVNGYVERQRGATA